MKKRPPADYSVFDREQILSFLFYPRREGISRGREHFIEMEIPVEDKVVIGGRFYSAGESAPMILFFHGNGEIVADYDDLGVFYNSMGIGFFAVDYRGYGRSTGIPMVSGMMRDCHTIFDYVRKYREQNRFSGPFVIMGRSLGSASALEIVSNYADRTDGLVVESGFAFIKPLLELLGVDSDILGIDENITFNHLFKIASYTKPTLIIHAEQDHIIPFNDGLALYYASQSTNKELLRIKDANHNNIFQVGFTEYMQAMRVFIDSLL
jgi:alpha-beta hydrolase superfamily lysophospholipase